MVGVFFTFFYAAEFFRDSSEENLNSTFHCYVKILMVFCIVDGVVSRGTR